MRINLFKGQHRFAVRRFLLCILITTLLYSCQQEKTFVFQPSSQSAALLPIMNNGVWGYCDTSGSIVIDPTYDWVSQYVSGVALASKGATTRLIDVQGNIVATGKYSSLQHSGHNSIVVVYNKNGSFGLFSTQSGDFELQDIKGSFEPFEYGEAVLLLESHDNGGRYAQRIDTSFSKIAQRHWFTNRPIPKWILQRQSFYAPENKLQDWALEPFVPRGQDSVRSRVLIDLKARCFLEDTLFLDATFSYVRLHWIDYSEAWIDASATLGFGERISNPMYRALDSKRLSQNSRTKTTFNFGGDSLGAFPNHDVTVLESHGDWTFFRDVSSQQYGAWNHTAGSTIPIQYDYLVLVDSVHSVFLAYSDSTCVYLNSSGNTIYTFEPDSTRTYDVQNIETVGFQVYTDDPTIYQFFGQAADSSKVYRKIKEYIPPSVTGNDVVVQLLRSLNNKNDKPEAESNRAIIANLSENFALFPSELAGLYMSLQALDSKGHWRTIHRSPQIRCLTNEPYQYLPPKYYWEIEVPAYSGEYATQFRLELNVLESYEKQDFTTLYSNTICGSINPFLFEAPQQQTLDFIRLHH